MSKTTEGLPANVEVYVAELHRRIHEVVAGDLVGVYLHGSVVLGGFNPNRSDIDVLVVVRAAPAPAVRNAIADRTSEESLPCPVAGLELSVVQWSVAQHPTASPAYELHVATQENKVIEDCGVGDADLVLHFAVCRAHGRLVGAGPEPAEVFAEVPPRLVLRQLRAELEWALREPGVATEYLVLNACRAWQFLDTGALTSKVAGGEWALDHGADGATVRAALMRQRAQPSGAEIEPSRVRALATEVIRKLENASGARA